MERISKNRIELEKVKVEASKVEIDKMKVLIQLLESTVPDEAAAFGEYTKFKSALDDIDSGIVKQKAIQLLKQF